MGWGGGETDEWGREMGICRAPPAGSPAHTATWPSHLLHAPILLRLLRPALQLQVRRQLHSTVRQAVREGGVLTPQAAAQLYALSARIEKPLHAGTCALYRELLRLCAAQRAALAAPTATGAAAAAGPAAAGGVAGEAAADIAATAAAASPLLPHLNILIIIAGAYFGQDEGLASMWDDEEE